MDEKLLGNWKVIACQANAVWLPREIFMLFEYEITPDRFKIHWAELSYADWKGSFPKSDTGSLSCDTDRNHIELTPDKGPNKDQPYLGIYHLDHDILKANFAFPGHDRPSGFISQPGEVYEVWQRV